MTGHIHAELLRLTQAIPCGGRSVEVETRAGPLAHPSRPGRPCIHLLLHDRSSWERQSIAAALQASFCATVLYGSAPLPPETASAAARARLGRRAAADVKRAVESLRGGKAPVGEWRFDPAPRWCRTWVAVADESGRAKLRRHAETVLRAAALAMRSQRGRAPSGAARALELLRAADEIAAGDTGAATARLVPTLNAAG